MCGQNSYGHRRNGPFDERDIAEVGAADRYALLREKCALMGSDCGNLRRMKNEMKNDSLQSAEGLFS